MSDGLLLRVRIPRRVMLASVLLLLAPTPATPRDDPAASEGTIHQAPLTYPYVAPKERAARIRENYVKVRPGMTPAQVVMILGEPDEIRPLYEPKIPNPRRIGTTYWFIVARRKPSGSANDKAEKLVRVSFDTSHLVWRVAHWGF